MMESIDIQKIINSPARSTGVYFIGIGGIGMSNLARYFHAKGVTVSGYDKTPTDLTRDLEQLGIVIHYEENIDLIPKGDILVVYTPAIPKDHAELIFYQNNGYQVAKRSEVLGAITRESFNICIAGTHGKTTITTMVSHILRHTGFGCNAFLGGISVNYGTNFWSSMNNVCVVEADEYDRSFLKLSPDIAVITSMDADHLDIYGNEASIQQAFVEFGNKVKGGGLLVSKFGLSRLKEVSVQNRISYSLQNESADFFAADIQIDNGGYKYNIYWNGGSLEGLELRIGGMHNVENNVAAIAIANYLDIDGEKIKEAIKAFKGVKRRFEYIIPPVPHEEGAYHYPVFIDDYAHHPEELKALLRSARSLFPQRKITVIFQPHLYTRTRDFADGFAHSLSLADEVVLLPIYPARELPMEGVNSEMILNKINKENKYIVDKDTVTKWMKTYMKSIDKEFGEVIITAGAGDIDTLVAPLKRIIEQRD